MGALGCSHEGVTTMFRLVRYHYLEYRRLGFNRLAALRFAWMVATA